MIEKQNQNPSSNCCRRILLHSDRRKHARIHTYIHTLQPNARDDSHGTDDAQDLWWFWVAGGGGGATGEAATGDRCCWATAATQPSVPGEEEEQQ
jgi:hypothetical protein